jgi:hypothetical protein
MQENTIMSFINWNAIERSGREYANIDKFVTCG